MRIGFDIQYKPHDAVYAAMRLSDSLRSIGYETTLFSKLKRGHTYGCDWDSVVVTPDVMSYEQWLKGITHIIWPVPPDKDLIHKVGKNIVTIALAPWDCLPAYSRKSFKLCAHTVAPSPSNAETLKKDFDLKNVSTVEWDSLIPVTRKDVGGVDTSKPKVLIPLHSSQGLRCDIDALFDVALGVNKLCPHAELSISYSPRCMSWEVVRELRHFFKKNHQIKPIIDSTTCVSSLLLYGNHDLVIWPAEIEGFGLVGIESLYMGTPVIAYDIPPISNIIVDGSNGVLVPCDKGGSTNGIVFAKPDANRFFNLAADIINHGLADLNKNTKLGRKTKRNKFNTSWKKIIEG